jgi:hypothetical protein
VIPPFRVLRSFRKRKTFSDCIHRTNVSLVINPQHGLKKQDRQNTTGEETSRPENINYFNKHCQEFYSSQREAFHSDLKKQKVLSNKKRNG